jgi:8-oxo-dGTP diphosphatase
METNSRTEAAEILREQLRNQIPHVSINCVPFGFHAGELRILLLKWQGVDLWSLPGRYVQSEESLDEVAGRVLFQKTGLENSFLHQFRSFGGTGRTEGLLWKLLGSLAQIPRDMPIPGRVVTVGYFALVNFDQVQPAADEFTERCEWHPARNHPPLAFAQDEIVDEALKTLKAQAYELPIGISMLPEKFTMPELQSLYEAVLETSLDRRNFQKKMIEQGTLVRLRERRFGGAHRAPFLYGFNVDRGTDSGAIHPSGRRAG